MTDQDFERYARMHSDMIFRIALNMLKNRQDSEDALQNTLIRFYRHGRHLKDEEHIKAWLIKVAQNEAKRILKKNASGGAQPLCDYAGAVFSDQLERKELFLSLMGLDEKYATALYLFYYEGYQTAEIASLTGTSPSTVRTRLSRGRELLKRVLSEEDYE